MSVADETFLKVQRILISLGFSPNLLPNNALRLRFSDLSTETIVSVHETELEHDGEKLTYVQVAAPVLFDVPIRPALLEWLALGRPSTLFGRFVIVTEQAGASQGMLIFEHGLIGNFLDPGELKTAIGVVLSLANEVDDSLAKQFGGRVAHPAAS